MPSTPTRRAPFDRLPAGCADGLRRADARARRARERT